MNESLGHRKSTVRHLKDGVLQGWSSIFKTFLSACDIAFVYAWQINRVPQVQKALTNDLIATIEYFRTKNIFWKLKIH